MSVSSVVSRHDELASGSRAAQILLAEDSDTDAELTLRALRRNNAHAKVVRVRDGAEALDFLFRRGPFAGRGCEALRLILLDLKMPRVDGLEVLRQIKACDDLRAIPVVVLTSSAEERDIAASYSMGVNSYVVKPVDFARFVDEVADAGAYWTLINRTPDGPATGSR